MKKKQARKRPEYSVSNCLLGFVGMIFLLTLAVVGTLQFRQLYYWDIEWLNIPKQCGMEAEEIRENYDALIDYNSINGPQELQFPTLPMSESGRIHFAEVKQVFLLFEYTAIGSGFLMLVGILVKLLAAGKGENRQSEEKAARSLRGRMDGREGEKAAGAESMSRTADTWGWIKPMGVFSIVLPVLFGGLIAWNWEEFFLLFHQLVFQNDYWLFDPRQDPVILMLPDSFFLHCAGMILLLVLLGSLFCQLLWRFLSRRGLRS